MDMDDPESVISPGGVGFDINCGVRLIRTNLMEEIDLNLSVKEQLVQALFDHIPVWYFSWRQLQSNAVRLLVNIYIITSCTLFHYF